MFVLVRITIWFVVNYFIIVNRKISSSPMVVITRSELVKYALFDVYTEAFMSATINESSNATLLTS